MRPVRRAVAVVPSLRRMKLLRLQLARAPRALTLWGKRRRYHATQTLAVSNFFFAFSFLCIDFFRGARIWCMLPPFPPFLPPSFFLFPASIVSCFSSAHIDCVIEKKGSYMAILFPLFFHCPCSFHLFSLYCVLNVSGRFVPQAGLCFRCGMDECWGSFSKKLVGATAKIFRR